MNDNRLYLGDKVSEQRLGISGIATAISLRIGCGPRVMIERLDSNGRHCEDWFDANRLSRGAKLLTGVEVGEAKDADGEVINLGDFVTDRHTGFTGTVTMTGHYMLGSPMIEIESAHDEKSSETRWLVATRVVICSKTDG